MTDVAEYLQKAHEALKQTYLHVSLNEYAQAYERAQDALYFARATLLWLKEKQPLG